MLCEYWNIIPVSNMKVNGISISQSNEEKKVIRHEIYKLLQA